MTMMRRIVRRAQETGNSKQEGAELNEVWDGTEGMMETDFGEPEQTEAVNMYE